LLFSVLAQTGKSRNTAFPACDDCPGNDAPLAHPSRLAEPAAMS
jgi:hypothetical protein